MAQVAEGTASVLERLGRRVQELEGRVAMLEEQASPVSISETNMSETNMSETRMPETRMPKPQLAASPAQPGSPALWQGLSPVEVTGGAGPTLGKAVLGMAGAFLLRAVAESGAVPILPILLVAIVYAVLWMVWAARVHASSRFASATFAVTSALILSPMLCECTLRFQVLPASLAAAVLAAFAGLALALAWRQKLRLVPWIATLVSTGTILALIVGTHALVPLTAALLAIALAVEAAGWLGERLSLRVLPALAADLSLWLLIDLLSSPEGVPEGYRAASPATIVALSLGLLAIYGGSIAVSSFALRRRIPWFDIGQGVAAFVLATWGAMRGSHGYGHGAAVLGALFLLLAAGCYWGAFYRFPEEPHEEPSEEPYAHNRRISATWAAALLVAGSFLLLPANPRVGILCLAAVAAAFAYTRTCKFVLGLHASVYLLAAAAFSPLPIYAGNALAGSVPAAPPWSIWAVVICAGVCYAIGSRATADRGIGQLLWVAPAALAGVAGAALAVAAIAGLAAARMELSASRLSVIRTMVICLLALGLGFLASRWKRVELGWVAYVAVAFGSLKLLLEDLRIGSAASLVLSLLFYGLILILLPLFMRRGRTDPA